MAKVLNVFEPEETKYNIELSQTEVDIITSLLGNCAGDLEEVEPVFDMFYDIRKNRYKVGVDKETNNTLLTKLF